MQPQPVLEPVPPQPAGTVLARAGAFARLPWGEKALFAAAAALIIVAAASLRVTSFRRLAPLFGKPVGAVGCVPLASGAQCARALAIRRAVLRAARLSPLRADCLPQALVAALLCRLLGVPASVHFGVKLNAPARAMDAHAWVCTGAVPVTGGYSFAAFTPVLCFLPAKLADGVELRR